MDEDEDRPKTLAQMAAEASENVWLCPRCGGTTWRVINSYMVDGKRRRQRACRVCHQPLQTYEIPAPKGCEVRVVKKNNAQNTTNSK